MMRDNPAYNTLGHAPEKVENSESEKDNNPIDLSRDLHKGDCMDATQKQIDEQ